MSVLTDKKVLIVGAENSQLFSLEESLQAHGVTLLKNTCDKITPAYLVEHAVDLIVLNNLAQDEVCTEMLKTIHEATIERAVPIFVMVDDSEAAIQNALLLGAADYITPHEDVQTIILKFKAVFGQGDLFCGATAIDITPAEASVTTTGIRVYVVEDDPLLRNLLSIKMDRSRFPCEFSNDGRDVIPAMHQFKPDVIILDLMLPGRSGFEVLKEVKDDEKLKDVPVIVFSNRDGQEDRQKAKELGAGGFYVKAMTDLSELIETIESLVK